MFEKNGTRLVWRWKEQILWVEPWGRDSIRVRATALAEMPLRGLEPASAWKKTLQHQISIEKKIQPGWSTANCPPPLT